MGWTSLAYLVKVVVLTDELFELGLDVHDSFRWEFELDEWDPSFFKMLQEPHLGWLKEHETSAFARSSRRTSNTVDVIPGVIRWVELHDPIYSGNLSKVSKKPCLRFIEEALRLNLLQLHR